MPVIEGAGVELAYREAGDGPAVVLVHGMAAGADAWPAEVAGARAIAYDRRGYGDSGAPEPYVRTTVAEQAEDLVALLSRIDAVPTAAVGADFGALVVLDVLLRHPGTVRGAVLVDPPAFPLVPEALEALAAERQALEEALREGGRGRAVAVWREAHGRPAVADAAGAAAGFFADYGGQATLALSRRQLRALEVPLVVLDSPGAPAHVRAAGDALAGMLPTARRGGAEDPVDALRAVMV